MSSFVRLFFTVQRVNGVYQMHIFSTFNAHCLVLSYTHAQLLSTAHRMRSHSSVAWVKVLSLLHVGQADKPVQHVEV